MSMIYIASPYTHKKEWVQSERFELVASFSAKVMREGGVAFSPIVHCHHICQMHSLPGDFEYWQKYCLTMLSKAKVMYVLMLDGWLESVGVQAEIAFAELNGIGVCYYSPEHAEVIAA